MNRLLNACLLVMLTNPLQAQELNLTIAGNEYAIRNDTLFIEKQDKAISVQLVYRVTGSGNPDTVALIDGGGSTLLPSSIITSPFPVRKRIGSEAEFAVVNFTFPQADTYSGDLFTNLIFTWPNAAKPADTKLRKFTIAVHKRKRLFDWVKDPGNTRKIEIIQYTDFLGINSDRPNGAFQQQYLFKWPIMKNYFSINEKFKIQPLRSILLPNILLNRIDKAKDDSSTVVPIGKSIVRTPDSDVPDTINNVIGSFDLIRYANTLIESSINLVTFHVDNARIYVAYDFGLLRNRVNDTSSAGKRVQSTIYSYVTGWHVYAKSTLDPKHDLNIEVEAGYRKVRLQDNYFRQYDVYAYQNDNGFPRRFPVRSSTGKSISQPIYYASVKLFKDFGKESQNHIFFRLKYQWQNGSYDFILKESPARLRTETYSNHFFQVNLGVSVGLDNLFNVQ